MLYQTYYIISRLPNMAFVFLLANIPLAIGSLDFVHGYDRIGGSLLYLVVKTCLFFHRLYTKDTTIGRLHTILLGLGFEKLHFSVAFVSSPLSSLSSSSSSFLGWT